MPEMRADETDIVQQQVKLGDVNFLLDLVDKMNLALDKVKQLTPEFHAVLKLAEQMQQVADRIRR